MTKILQIGWDKELTKAENLSMDDLDEADIWPIDIEPFADRWPTVSLKITTKKAPDDYFQVGSIEVVSDQIKTTMETFNVKVEFLPIQVFYKGKLYSNKSYFFCHILDQVDCFDHEQGRCTFHEAPGFKDRIDEIEKLAIDEQKAEGHHLFRLAKGAEYIICMSDELAKQIQASKATGARFIAPEDWC